MVLLSIGMLRYEVITDAKSISEGRGDKHTMDLILAGIVISIISVLLALHIHPVWWAFATTYWGFRVLLFDQWLNDRMGWPQMHFRNEGFDKIFYGKQPHEVWIIKTTLFVLLQAPLIAILIW